MSKIKLSLEEQINRAKDGRTQAWIVSKMNEKGIVINDVKFTRKKKGQDDFKEDELKVLSDILGVEIKL